MQIRNPSFNGSGGIDCEIEHPRFGWIAFTARQDDPASYGADIYAAALAMGPAAYTPPPEPEPITVPDLLAYLADRRWQRETAGIEVGGITVATDDRSKLMLSGARIAASADPGWSTRWKTAAGWVGLTSAEIIAVSNAVQAHVSACFAAEADIAALIESGQITDFAGIDAALA